MQTETAMLCSRVKAPGRKEWSKLVRMMKFLSMTKNNLLMLSAGKGITQIEWYMDAAFRVHPDYKGHTGAAMKFKGRKGAQCRKAASRS